MNNHKIKFLAYYLPQFHPIPENDKWWGKGFTEWTNVRKAKPLFKEHYQPIEPGELGYYDLLQQPNIQEKQTKLAKEYGIDGFIYYQYWFGDKMLLEKPAEAMLKNKNVDIPFCFCWANETWKGIWHGLDNPKVLIAQEYLGKEGYIKYFDYLLPFFKDTRYIKVNNMPMFHIYKLDDIPDLEVFIDVFNNMAKNNGFDGVYFVGTVISKKIHLSSIYGIVGVDVFMKMRYGLDFWFFERTMLGRVERKIKKTIRRYQAKVGHIDDREKPLIFDYQEGVKKLNIEYPHEKYIPCVFPNWDNTARSGNKAMIFKNSNPAYWKLHLINTLKEQKKHPKNPPFLVIKSWNEWAEGNYLEPDKKYGLEWLEVIKMVKKSI